MEKCIYYNNKKIYNYETSQYEWNNLFPVKQAHIFTKWQPKGEMNDTKRTFKLGKKYVLWNRNS